MPHGNETGVPYGNETGVPYGNETSVPYGMRLMYCICKLLVNYLACTHEGVK